MIAPFSKSIVIRWYAVIYSKSLIVESLSDTIVSGTLSNASINN